MTRLVSLFLLLVAVSAVAVPAAAQPAAFSAAERLQGYALRGDTTVFVFDAAAYALTPDRVAVTGAFRGWDTDMDAPSWLLARGPESVWTLAVPNARYEAVAPAAPFKFRADADGQMGRWLDPPAGAQNAEGGNLVFLFGAQPSRARAELRGARAVWVEVTGDEAERPLAAGAYRIVDAENREIPVAEVLPNTDTQTLVVPARDLDRRRVYFVEIEQPGGRPALRAWASFDGWFRTLYSDKPLGAEVDGGRTDIRLFAPRADRVTVNLYEAPTGRAFRQVQMQKDLQGVWETSFPQDLHGVYYDFAVYGPDDPGNHFFEQTGQTITDPYARVSLDSWGRARIWRATEPATPLQGGRPAMEDVVAYEVHVQDFTDRLPVGGDLAGTIPAMVQPGLTNSRGEPVGFDYLVDLGVNVVHLMPVQEFLHYPDDAWQEAFGDDSFMQRMGVAQENYQWGYRITHYMAVESRFRQRGTEPGMEREQFRDLVQAFHDRGIAVIVDFVFNHTGENMEGRQQLFNFNGIDKAYYYRLLPDQAGTFDHIGVFGNEVKSEDRPMVQRWLIDQCKMFVDEFGVDGFRIDLAGQTDQQSLEAVRAALPDDLIWYGEPWIGSNDPAFEANPAWDWYKTDAPIPFFQDDARNAFKGPTSTPTDPATDRGYAGGDGTLRGEIKLALTNRWPDEREANRGVNYLDIHDNWALADQFASTTSGPDAWDGRKGVDEDAYRLASVMLMTSAGPVVLHGGVEMLRSKGLAPHPDEIGGEQVLTDMDLAPIYIKGRGDTYNLRTPNQFDWETVGMTRADPESPGDVAGMHQFWKELIALRLSDYGAPLRIGGVVPEGHYRFIEPADPQHLGYIVDGSVLVLLNTGDTATSFSVDLPAGQWGLAVDGARASADADLDGPDAALLGGARSLAVPAKSARVWIRTGDAPAD